MLFSSTTCAPFADLITEINNTQVDDTQKIDVVIAMYDFIEYSDPYSKTSGRVYQYYTDGPTLYKNGNIIDFLMITIIVFHSNLNKI